MNAPANSGKRAWVLACSMGLALGLGGCAEMQTQPSPGASPQQAGTQPEHHCNTGAAAAIGGLLGALAGKGNGHLVGAAVGAGIGALICTAYNYHVRQIRDAKAVNAEYLKHHDALPQFNTVTGYTSTLQPGSTIKAGSDVSLASNITVVEGTQDAPPQVSQKLTLVSPEGKELSSSTKVAKEIAASGEYATGFAFNLPKGVKDGRYTVRTEVLLNGRPVRTDETPMLVVS